MGTIIEQLQQLTDAQLCVMCHEYLITPGHITPQSRRYLERKLHVAIIEESAKQRALDYMAREKDEAYQQDLYARGRGSNTLPPRPTIQSRPYSHGTLEIRHSQNVSTMTTPSVHKIDGTWTRWPSPLPYTTRRSYERRRSYQNSSIIPNFVKSFAKELPLMIWRGLEKQLSPMQRFRGGEQQNMFIEEEPAPTSRTVDAQDDTTSDQILSQVLQNTYEEETQNYPYGLDYEELYRYTHETDYSDIDTDNDDVSARANQTDSFTSLDSSNDEFVADNTAVERTPPKGQTVRSIFKFPWWPTAASIENARPVGLEHDHISEHEKELYTLEYLSDDQKQAEQNKEVRDIMIRGDFHDDSEDETVPLSNQRQLVEGTRAFFRSIYEFLCCDHLGMLNPEKVRCILFFSGMLVFVCYSYKKLQ